ncbi:MAG: ParA family protein [Coriobacteriia bacterium]|nr:ParA family protein [Coriobacteriia bacterium]
MFTASELTPLTLITGHYGVGKTNLTINFALDLREAGKQVTVVDLDIVNPYFRSSDYTQMLEGSGIEVIAPTFAGTTLDTPVLSAALSGVFERDGFVLVDAGGDDVGATAMGRYRQQIGARDFEMLYVVNANRNLTVQAAGALEVMREIEAVCGLNATGIVNNTHLQNETTCETILQGEPFGVECAQLTGLPLVCVSVPKGMECDGMTTPPEKQYPTEIYVKPPWM